MWDRQLLRTILLGEVYEVDRAVPALVHAEKDRIRPYRENPFYWEFKRKPVVLLGGSNEHNLFQVPGVEAHLDEMCRAGGNYVRCGMSSREEGNVHPYALTGGLYDLDRWNDEYWRRFSDFLKVTAERDVIVQIEVWDPHDYFTHHWDKSPYNPKNNRNYTSASSGLPEAIDRARGLREAKNEHPFFNSIPSRLNLEIVLRYQQRFVDKLLEYSMPYGHVLYCVSNESWASLDWSIYWAEYIRRHATGSINLEVGEMRWQLDLTHPDQLAVLDRPDVFSFVDVSQNSTQKGETHWERLQAARARIADAPRPLTNVKIYGANAEHNPDIRWTGSEDDAVERFWRNIFGGAASSRFHRPTSGIGLSDAARAHIKSLRMVTDAVPFHKCEPRNDLLLRRGENAAYLMADGKSRFALFFPRGEAVDLDLRGAEGPLSLEWLDIPRSEWRPAERLDGGRVVTLTPPSAGYWAAVVRRV